MGVNPRDEADNNPRVVVGETSREETLPEATTRPADEPAAPAPIDLPSRPAAVPEGDLGLLVTGAEKRFSDATAAKVADAVEKHGREWVEVAVFGLPRLESWRGVLGALGNWRRGPDGPTAEEVKAARRSLAAARPTVFHQAPARSPRPGRGVFVRRIARPDRFRRDHPCIQSRNLAIIYGLARRRAGHHSHRENHTVTISTTTSVPTATGPAITIPKPDQPADETIRQLLAMLSPGRAIEALASQLDLQLQLNDAITAEQYEELEAQIEALIRHALGRKAK
jgi:hypothetical protein